MRRFLQKLILMVFSLFPLEAFRFARFISNSRLSSTLVTLQRRGLKIKTVYDIGANDGEWSKRLKVNGLKHSQFVLFEANESHESALKETGFKYVIGALSSDEKYVDFFSKSGTGDSYFLENSVHYSTVSPKRVLASTLDKLIEKNSLPSPDLIKLDTQGSEIDILKGGTLTLGSVSLIVIECPIVQYNIGAPNIHEYISFLINNDFVPIDVTEIIYQADILVQIDLIFMRKTTHESIFGTAPIKIK